MFLVINLVQDTLRLLKSIHIVVVSGDTEGTPRSSIRGSKTFALLVRGSGCVLGRLDAPGSGKYADGKMERKAELCLLWMQ